MIDDSELGQRRVRSIHRLMKQLDSELGEKLQASPINLGEIAIAGSDHSRALPILKFKTT